MLTLIVGILLVVLSVPLSLYGIYYSALSLLISFILLKPYRVLRELLLGTHIILPTTRGRTFFLVERRRGARREYWYGAYLEFTDVHYGVSDLDVKSFIGRARAVLEGIMFDPNANYTFIVKRRNGRTRVFLQVLVRDVDRNALKPRMQALLGSILKHLRTHGIEARITSVDEAKSIRIRKTPKSRRALSITLAIIVLILLFLRLRIIIGQNIVAGDTGQSMAISDLWLCYLLASLLPIAFSTGSYYKVVSPHRVLLSNEAIYTTPSPYDVYNASRWVHQIFNTSGDFTLILKLRPAPHPVLDAIESKAYKLYE
ncbi:MAG: hypothetical protein DRJ49_06730, partial [Thermoprotei archaeon]